MHESRGIPEPAARNLAVHCHAHLPSPLHTAVRRIATCARRGSDPRSRTMVATARFGTAGKLSAVRHPRSGVAMNASCASHYAVSPKAFGKGRACIMLGRLPVVSRPAARRYVPIRPTAGVIGMGSRATQTDAAKEG
jgi:hypothetical protein